MKLRGKYSDMAVACEDEGRWMELNNFARQFVEPRKGEEIRLG